MMDMLLVMEWMELMEFLAFVDVKEMEAAVVVGMVALLQIKQAVVQTYQAEADLHIFQASLDVFLTMSLSSHILTWKMVSQQRTKATDTL